MKKQLRMVALSTTILTFTFQSVLAQSISPTLSAANSAISAPVNDDNLAALLEAISSLENEDPATAHLILGSLYEDGVWFPQDSEQALAHFTASDEEGSWLGQVARARLLSTGSSADQERAYQIALDARRQANDMRNSNEITFQEWDNLNLVLHPVLGSLALNKAVEFAKNSDFENAFEHYFMASEAGIQHASMAVGYMYLNGVGTPQNLKWAEAQFLGASYCSERNLEFYSYDQNICEQATVELNSTRVQIQDRDRREQEQTYAILALIGLGTLTLAAGLGNAASGGGAYQPPNIDQNPGVQMAGQLMWLGKW
ncbi:tetratricopeptide repeat protein [uncultured Aliiroseovarius sp.]|uniref:tetratricopeptide repeat protein n=1 Tax=uncultured Aliiroseovarius sp. TaxID=1658783 RepID=UPI00262E1132|nr:tetratricopeptide repeat protein [uncultured Aliiroseovarius sp.]